MNKIYKDEILILEYSVILAYKQFDFGNDEIKEYEWN